MTGTAGEPADVPRRPPAVQLGFLWGAAAVSAAALALAFRGRIASVASALPACPVKALTGLPCPACGSGRAAVALARLDFASAFVLNPLFAAAAVVFLAGGLAALAAALAGRGVPEPRTLSAPVRAAVVLAVAANWAWLLLDGR